MSLIYFLRSTPSCLTADPLCPSMDADGQSQPKVSLKQRANWGRASRKLTYQTLILVLASVFFKGLWHLVFVGKAFAYTIKYWGEPKAHFLSLNFTYKLLNCNLIYITASISLKDHSQCLPAYRTGWHKSQECLRHKVSSQLLSI